MEPFLAYTMLRLALGLNIFLHGFVRWQSGTRAFAKSLETDYTGSIIPIGAVKSFGLLLPSMELLIGLLLVLGLATQVAIMGGFLLMLLLLFGRSVKGDWLVVSLQMIYIAYYVLLEWCYRFNSYSLDTFLHNKIDRLVCL